MVQGASLLLRQLADSEAKRCKVQGARCTDFYLFTFVFYLFHPVPILRLIRLRIAEPVP